MTNIINMNDAIECSEFIAVRPPRDRADWSDEFKAIDDLLRGFYQDVSEPDDEVMRVGLIKHMRGENPEPDTFVMGAENYLDAWKKAQDTFFTTTVLAGSLTRHMEAVDRLYVRFGCPTEGFDDGLSKGFDFVWHSSFYIKRQVLPDVCDEMGEAFADQFLDQFGIALPPQFHHLPHDEMLDGIREGCAMASEPFRELFNELQRIPEGVAGQVQGLLVRRGYAKGRRPRVGERVVYATRAKRMARKQHWGYFIDGGYELFVGRVTRVTPKTFTIKVEHHKSPCRRFSGTRRCLVGETKRIYLDRFSRWGATFKTQEERNG